MSILEPLRFAGLAIWVAIAIVMTPGAWRMLRHRARSLDALWLGSWMLSINRVSFTLSVLFGRPDWLLLWCYLTALVTGGVWLLIVRGYQRHDA